MLVDFMFKPFNDQFIIGHAFGRNRSLILTDLKENCAMKSKTGTKSIKKKQVEAVNKRLSPSRKSSLTKKIKETGNHKSGSKGLAAVRKHTARRLNYRRRREIPEHHGKYCRWIL